VLVIFHRSEGTLRAVGGGCLAVCVAVLTACGSTDGSGAQASDRADVQQALTRHIEAIAVDDPDLIAAGPLRSVTCSELGERFRGAPVYHCSAEHETMTADWCAALVEGDLYTQNDAEDFPCIPGSATSDPTTTSR
jgi:hypothetical protein